MPIIKAMTTGDLISKLRALDPSGTLPVALSGSCGGTVRPVDDVEIDTLLVCSEKAKKAYPENRFFASRGMHQNASCIKRLGLVVKGQCVFID